MTKRLSMGALLVAVAVLFTAMAANAVPKPSRGWVGKEDPSHAIGMPLFFRAQAGTTWVNVGDTDCTPADTENSTHGPSQVWCFEGAGGDSLWPGHAGNPWQSWSKFDPPLPPTSKWHLSTQYNQGGSTLQAWCGCDLVSENTACEETAFWTNPANIEGYGDDWNYPLQLNINGGNHTGGGSINFDIRYDAECNYDYIYLEYVSGFSVVGPDTVLEWSEAAKFNGVSGTFGLSTCGDDELGHSDTDSSGTAQYGNSVWVPGVSVPLPTTGGTSATNTRLRWRAYSDGAWSDADDRADTQGLVMLDNVSVTFTSGGSVSDNFDSGSAGNTFTTPTIGGAVTSASWVIGGLEGNKYNPWRVAFDPDYKNQGNTCEFTADWMFTTRIPVFDTYTTEARWDYYLVSPVIPCAGWTGGVMEFANYFCAPEANASGAARSDYQNTLVRVHNGNTGSWSLWNDFDGYIIFGGCEFWNMNETEDLTPFIGGDIDSLQLGYEMLDLSQPTDFQWAKHKNTSWQIDRVSIGSFDGSATSFGTSSIRIFQDTFSLVDPAHTAQMDNDEQGDWVGQAGGTRDLAADDSLTIDIHDPDGMSSANVQLHYRIGTGTPPAFGAWASKAMVLQTPDNQGTAGEGTYATTLGNLTTEDFNPGAEGSPDYIWAAGQTVQYYISATDDLPETRFFPADSSAAPLRFQVLPLGRTINGAGQNVLVVDDYTRNDLDFENSTGFVANGGAGYGSFTDAVFDQPEDMIERALILLAGGDEDGTNPPVDGGPKWDIYNVNGAGSSVQCEPRIRADDLGGVGGVMTELGSPNYDAVIWTHGTFTTYSYGDSSSAQLVPFLNNGGHLLSMGSDIVDWATAAGGTTLVVTLMEEYLGTTYGGNQVEWRVCNVTGEAGTSLEGTKFGLYGECNGIRKTYDQLQLSVLVPPTNSVLARYSDSNNPVVPVTNAPAVIKNVVNSSGVSVQTGFDIGSMLSDQSRACFIGAILGDEFGITGLNATVCNGANDGVGVAVGQSRFGFELAAAAPNPFRDATSIQFSLANRSHVSIEVYNILGQKVRTLVDDTRDAASYVEVWDGRSDGGAQVSSGIYFYKMVAGDYSATKKAVLLK